MELVRVDTQRAYALIMEKITTLELKPGAPVNEQKLAVELGFELVPVREALKLLIHDGLVVPHARGLYVADVNPRDLAQLSELRLLLESFAAQQAAERATPDDLVVLDALLQEYTSVPSTETKRLFDIDHKFHTAIARAAQNKYLENTLEMFFGLSQRLWFLALPHLDFLSKAVDEHRELVDAIKAGEGERAGQLMYSHIKDFYDRVYEVLSSLDA